jgi:hypothetical protein
VNEIRFEMPKIKGLIVACKITMPGIEQQTKRKPMRGRKESIHYL